MSVVQKESKVVQKIVCDVGSERAVLSGLCQYGKDGLVDISDIITVDTFTNENNKALFQCISNLLEEINKIDITSVIAKANELNLEKLICKEKLDLEYLRSLFTFPLLLENVRPHAKRIAKLEIVRKAQAKHVTAYKALQEITGSESIDEILATSEKPVFELIDEISSNRENNPVKLGKNAEEHLKDLEENPCENIGLPTPFPRFNKVIGGGLRKGYVDLIVTRPKGFKSTTALSCGIHLALNNIPVFYADTEMDTKSQIGRLIAQRAQVDINDIETGRFGQNPITRKKVYDAAKLIKDSPFFHQSVAGCQFDEILSMARRWVMKDVGLGKDQNALLIYDYFKLMDPSILKDMQEHQAVGFQISKLTDFCKEYGLSCLTFAQLNRSGIDKDTSDIISQSDRLLWLAASASFLRRKTSEEITHDGPENGNLKLKTIECRFGSGLNDNDHINFQVTGEMFTLKELNTNFDVSKKKAIITETTDSVDF